jgi:CRISPR/Cas system CSM-associated protein Csm4 (group 5 of RAMP superfamily)
MLPALNKKEIKRKKVKKFIKKIGGYLGEWQLIKAKTERRVKKTEERQKEASLRAKERKAYGDEQPVFDR